MTSRYSLLLLGLATMACEPASAAVLSGFGPKTYSSQEAFTTDFRKTSSGALGFQVGTYQEQANVVRHSPGQGNIVYTAAGSSSSEKALFDLSNTTTFSLDFYIEGAAADNRIGVAAVNASESHSLVGSFYTQAGAATPATGFLRFEDYDFSANATRNAAPSEVSEQFTLDVGVWYRVSMEFSGYDSGVVDVTLALHSLSARGGAITGTLESLTLNDFQLSTYSLGNEVQYGIYPGAKNEGRFLLDGFYAESIPEPGAVSLGALAALAMLYLRRRR